MGNDQTLEDFLQSEYDDGVTVSQTLQLLATFELSQGTKSIEVPVSEVEERVDDFINRIDNGEDVEDITQSVKNKVHTLN